MSDEACEVLMPILDRVVYDMLAYGEPYFVDVEYTSPKTHAIIECNAKRIWSGSVLIENIQRGYTIHKIRRWIGSDGDERYPLR